MMRVNTATNMTSKTANDQPPAGAVAEHQTGAGRAYIPAASPPPGASVPDASAPGVSAAVSHLVAGDAFLASLAAVIEPVLVHHGWNLVRVRLFGGHRAKAGKGSRPRIQIMAEPAEERPMTVEDCAAISRLVSPVMDVENLMESRYTLEVSSPGIDRPLTRTEDFARFQGCRAEIELADAAEDGRKRFTGTIQPPEAVDSVRTAEREDAQKKAQEEGQVQAAAQVISLAFAGEIQSFPFPSIVRAKLLQEDDVLAQPPGGPGRKHGRGRPAGPKTLRPETSRPKTHRAEDLAAKDPRGRRPAGPKSTGPERAQRNTG